jgi:hypothetical protein
VLPTVIQRGGTPPWIALVVLVIAVLVVGIGTSLLAVRTAVRSSILSGLRSE